MFVINANIEPNDSFASIDLILGPIPDDILDICQSKAMKIAVKWIIKRRPLRLLMTMTKFVAVYPLEEKLPTHSKK